MSFFTGLRLGASAVVLVSLSVSGVQAESLEAALTAAYAHNPTIQSALYAVKVAAENIALKKAGTRPQVGVGTSLTDSFATTSAGIAHQPKASVGLTYQQTLYDSHKTDAEVEAARAQVEVANQGLRTTEANALLSTVQAYMNVILNTQLVQLRSDTVQFYQSQVKASQDRQNIGEGTKIDVAQAQASYASAVASQKAAIAALQTAQASYVQWVGHKPRNLSSDFNYGSLIPASVERALALAASRNPTVLGARASIRAARATAIAAADAFGPSVTATGSVGPALSATCLGASCGAGTGAALAGQVGLSFSLPLYAGGALGAAQRLADLNAIKSGVDEQATLQQVNQQVVTAWSTLQNAAAQIESANTAVQAGELALQGVIQERDVGQKTTLDVLNQEATLETSKEALISANANKVIAAFTLIAQEGRLTAADLRLGTPTKSARAYIEEVEDTWEEVRSFAPMPRPTWRR
jgi:outer membrane protein